MCPWYRTLLAVVVVLGVVSSAAIVLSPVPTRKCVDVAPSGERDVRPGVEKAREIFGKESEDIGIAELRTIESTLLRQLEFQENCDFLLTPAILVQAKLRGDIVMYPDD